MSEQQPEDILCLGARNGLMSRTLNTLEDKYSPKYNKKRYMPVYPILIDQDRLNQVKKLQSLQHMTAVRDWNVKFA